MQRQIIFGEFIYILAILQVKWKEKLWLLNLIQFKLFFNCDIISAAQLT